MSGKSDGSGRTNVANGKLGSLSDVTVVTPSSAVMKTTDPTIMVELTIFEKRFLHETRRARFS